MRRTHIAFLSVGLLFGSLSLVTAAQAANEGTDTVPPPPQIQQADPNAQPDANAAQPDATTPQPQAPSSQSNDGITPTTPAQSDANAPTGTPNYDLTTIIIDYKEYKVGDTVPQQYTEKTYTITEWQKRNLPAPQENTHWAYINANYILITNDTGKIVMGKSGDIFFRG